MRTELILVGVTVLTLDLQFFHFSWNAFIIFHPSVFTLQALWFPQRQFEHHGIDVQVVKHAIECHLRTGLILTKCGVQFKARALSLLSQTWSRCEGLAG